MLTGLDELPLSVNVWRCFLVLVGGMGIIVLAVAILPLLGVGGAQLFKAEMAGPMKDAKLTPRIAETARGPVGACTSSLAVACFFAYRCGRHELGRRLHAHVHDHGPGRLLVARRQLRPLELAADRGRGGGLHAAGRRQLGAVLRRLAAALAAAAVAQRRGARLRRRDGRRGARWSSLYLWHARRLPDYLEALRHTVFHVVSIGTTTGYATQDYAQWPMFAPLLMLLLGCFATCAGSTGGGIKMVRMLLLLKQAQRELVRIVHPQRGQPGGHRRPGGQPTRDAERASPS